MLMIRYLLAVMSTVAISMKTDDTSAPSTELYVESRV